MSIPFQIWIFAQKSEKGKLSYDRLYTFLLIKKTKLVHIWFSIRKKHVNAGYREIINILAIKSPASKDKESWVLWVLWVWLDLNNGYSRKCHTFAVAHKLTEGKAKKKLTVNWKTNKYCGGSKNGATILSVREFYIFLFYWTNFYFVSCNVWLDLLVP